MALWNSAAWNGSTRSPPLVVPSGNTPTCRPARSAAIIVSRVRCAAAREPRARKMVSVLAHSQPISGQCATSSFATKPVGASALMTKMSSQEMWFATTSPAGGGACAAPPAPSFTPSVSSSWRDQRRLSMRRGLAPSQG